MNYKNTVSLIALCAALATMPASAQEITAQDILDVKIEAQRLDHALNLLTQQAGFQILTHSEDFMGKITKPLNGSYTYKEALEILLIDTGLSYKKVNDNTFAIRPISNGGLGVQRISYNEDSYYEANMAVNVDDAARDVENSNVFEEIIVTSQKREASVQSVALSVTAMTEDFLKTAGVRSLTDLGSLVAGIEITSINPESNAVASRGVTQAGELEGGVEATAVIGLYLDETPLTAFGANFPSIAFWDVNRVEFLRGPQGTLFGEGSMAGTIRVVSNKPDLYEASGKVATGLSFQKDGDMGWNIRSMVNIPVIEDKLAVRATVGYEEQGGWIDVVDLGLDNTNDTRRVDAKVAVRLQASDELTIDASFVYQKLHLDDSFFQTHPGENDPQNQMAGVTLITELSATDTEFKIYNLTINYDFGGATLVSASSYFDTSRDAFNDLNPNIPIFFSPGTVGTGAGDFQNSSEVFTQELRLVSNGDEALDWTIGAFYKKMNRTSEGGFSFQFDPFIPEFAFLGFPFGATFDDFGIVLSESDVESYALFAEAEYELTEELSLTVGGRYYSDDRTLVGTNLTGSLVFGNVAGAVSGPVPGSDKSFAPNVILKWDGGEGVIAFAKVSKGFRSGGVNLSSFNFDGIPEDFKAETLWSYEAGIKTQNLVENVQANLYAYYTEWSDLQLDFVGAGGFAGFKDNAGGARAYGAELEILAKPTDGLTLNMNSSYTNSVLTETVVNALGGILAEDGNGIPGVPAWKINVGIDYQTPVSNDLTGRFHVDYTYRDTSFTDVENNPDEVNDAYHLLHLRVGVEGEQWGAYVVVRNLTDNRSSTIRSNRINGSPLISANYFRPRTIGFEFTADF